MHDAKGDGEVEVGKANVAGYVWNAFGLFFRRGVWENSQFPPAEQSLERSSDLEYTMWEAFVAQYELTDN